RAEVARLVPESDPWWWNRDETRFGCVQGSTDRKGVSLGTRNLVSDISFTDEQWDLVYPAVQRLAAESGLTEVSAMANSSHNHDVRFSSKDGRTLVFGSKEASLIKGRVACRRSAESPPA
ncbi:LppA family lipoprotein, partial [Mycolicibacterium thermoresistibile]